MKRKKKRDHSVLLAFERGVVLEGGAGRFAGVATAGATPVEGAPCDSSAV